ncbi:hypothetical protein [Mycolicibacterium sp. PDY-3]|uniref:hypothetical protein n=1 Tax=Mycolicibacterium sp. PDY-3 TaxID=3376069 RepID=UPI00379E7C0F
MVRIEKGFKNSKVVGAKVDLATSITVKNVTVALGQTSGTATVPTGWVPLGILPAGNQDQYVDNVAVSGTTLTVTLAAAATAANQYKVSGLEA